MRILLFADTDQLDSIGSLFLRIAALEREAGHETILVGLSRGDAPPAATPLGEAAVAQSIPFRLILQRRELDPGILGQAEAMLRRLKPDLFQSHNLKGAILCGFARWIPEAWQTIVPEYDSRPKPKPVAWLERWRYRRASECLLPASAAEAAIAAWKLNPSRVRRLAAPADDQESWARAAVDGAAALDPKRGGRP